MYIFPYTYFYIKNKSLSDEEGMYLPKTVVFYENNRLFYLNGKI